MIRVCLLQKRHEAIVIPKLKVLLCSMQFQFKSLVAILLKLYLFLFVVVVYSNSI